MTSLPPHRASRHFQRFEAVLSKTSIDKSALANLAWQGIPPGQSRWQIWQICLGCRPSESTDCEEVLQHSRETYCTLRRELYESSKAICEDEAEDMALQHTGGEVRRLQQIRTCLPCAQVKLDQTAVSSTVEQVLACSSLQSMMERILFVWTVKESSSACLPCVVDILSLLLLIGLADKDDSELHQLEPAVVPRLGESRLAEVEADTYWCMTKVVSLLNDHHDEGFTGIHRMTKQLMELVWRIDEDLARHLDSEGINILVTGVRWIGSLMVRELTANSCARLWDTLFAEYAQTPDKANEDFEAMLLYFCACLLEKYSQALQEMDSEAITLFLGRAPGARLDVDDVGVLLSEAFYLKETFHQARNHLQRPTDDAQRPTSDDNVEPPVTPGPNRLPRLSVALPKHVRRLQKVLGEGNVDKNTLAALAWKGVPSGISRSHVWRLLLDYMPSSAESCAEVLKHKRKLYRELRTKFYDAAMVADPPGSELESKATLSGDAKLLKQIRKDLPRMQVNATDSARTSAVGRAVKCPQILILMERVLFVWAVLISPNAYAQGIDSILLLLALVLLSDRAGCDPEQLDPECIESLGEDALSEVEADSYWCLQKLLSLMCDHHDESFSGIHRMTEQLMEHIWRIDENLASHLSREGVNMLATGVRWIGCLMVRELPVIACARLWDSLIAEHAREPSEPFETLLLYFCYCFLGKYSLQLLDMDFEAITMFLGGAPPEALDVDSVEVLLGEAFVLRSMFHEAPSHLKRHDSNLSVASRGRV